MRAGIGLLGLLIAVAIIFWLAFGPTGGGHSGYVGTVMTQGKNGQEQANQISGHDENGVPVSESIKLDEVDVGGHFKRLKVVSVVAGGPFATAYGLQAGDEISEIAGLGVDMNNDPGLAEAQVFEAYSRNQPLTIVRGGQTMTVTPKSPLTGFPPEMFGQPGAAAIPTH